MSIEHIREMAQAGISLKDLPNSFTAKVMAMRLDKDKTGRECVYLVLELKDKRQITQKLTPMHLSELVKFFDAMKIENADEFVGKYWTFSKKEFRIGFPRWLPVAEKKLK